MFLSVLTINNLTEGSWMAQSQIWSPETPVYINDSFTYGIQAAPNNENFSFSNQAVTVKKLALERTAGGDCYFTAADIGHGGTLQGARLILDVDLKIPEDCKKKVLIAPFGSVFGKLINVSVEGKVTVNRSDEVQLFKIAIFAFGQIQYLQDTKNGLKLNETNVTEVSFKNHSATISCSEPAFSELYEAESVFSGPYGDETMKYFVQKVNNESDQKKVALHASANARAYFMFLKATHKASVLFYNELGSQVRTAATANQAIYHDQVNALLVYANRSYVHCKYQWLHVKSTTEAECTDTAPSIDHLVAGPRVYLLQSKYICPNGAGSINNICINQITDAAAQIGFSSTNKELVHCSNENEYALSWPDTKPCQSKCPDNTFTYMKGCYKKCPAGTVENETDKSCSDPTSCSERLWVEYLTNHHTRKHYCADVCPPRYYNDNNNCMIQCPELKIGSNGKCVEAPDGCIKSGVNALYLVNRSCENLCFGLEIADLSQTCVSNSPLQELTYEHLKQSMQLCDSNYDGGILWVRATQTCATECEYINSTNQICETFDSDNPNVHCPYFYIDKDKDDQKTCVKNCSVSGQYLYTIEPEHRCSKDCTEEITFKFFWMDADDKQCKDTCTHYVNVLNITQRICQMNNNCKDNDDYKYTIFDGTLNMNVCYKTCPETRLDYQFVINTDTLFCGTCSDVQQYFITYISYTTDLPETKYKVKTCITCPADHYSAIDSVNGNLLRCERECALFTPPSNINQILGNGTLTCSDKPLDIKNTSCPSAKQLYNPENNSFFNCTRSTDEKCIYSLQNGILIYLTQCASGFLQANDTCPQLCKPNCPDETPHIAPNMTCVKECDEKAKYILEQEEISLCVETCGELYLEGQKCVKQCTLEGKFYYLNPDGEKQCIQKCEDNQYFIVHENYHTQCLNGTCKEQSSFNIEQENSKKCVNECVEYLFTQTDGTKNYFANCTLNDKRQDDATRTCSTSCLYFEKDGDNICTGKCTDSDPYLNVSENKCVKICKPPFYADIRDPANKKCTQCPLVRYENISNKEIQVCLSICNEPNVTLEGDVKQCLKECPNQGLFANRVCDNTLCCDESYCSIEPKFILINSRECLMTCPLAAPYVLNSNNSTCIQQCPDDAFKVIEEVKQCCSSDKDSCKYYVHLPDQPYQCYDECPDKTRPLVTEIEDQFQCIPDGQPCPAYDVDGICVQSCSQYGLLYFENKSCTNCDDNKHYIEKGKEKECVSKLNDKCKYIQPTEIIVNGSSVNYNKCLENCTAVDNKNQEICVGTCDQVFIKQPDGLLICYDKCSDTDKKYVQNQECVSICSDFVTEPEPESESDIKCSVTCDEGYNYYQLETDGKKTCQTFCPVNYEASAEYPPMYKCVNENCPNHHNGNECVKDCGHGEVAQNGACVTECYFANQYVQNNQCVKKCPSDYYQIINGFKQCVPQCEEGKASITDAVTGVTQCLDQIKCPEGYIISTTESKKCILAKQCHHYIEASQCLDNCPDGFYLETPQSQKCVSKCNGYILPTTPNKQCVTRCPANLPIVVNGVCNGVSKCSSATINDEKECLPSDQCQPGQFEYEIDVNGAIVKLCAIKCPSHLPKLNGKRCEPLLECNGEYVLNNECVSDCPVYLSDMTCVSKCATDEFLDPITKRCLHQCPSEKYVFDSLTQTKICQISCQHYSVPDSSGMQLCVDKCESPSIFVNASLVCVVTCSQGSFSVSNQDGSLMCKEKCDPKMQIYDSQLQHFKCIDNCNSNGYQLNDTQCVESCKGVDKFLYKGKCIDVCPDGYYYQNTNNEVQCQLQCAPESSFIESLSNLTCVSCVVNGQLFYSFSKDYVRVCQKDCKSFSSSKIDQEIPIKITQCINKDLICQPPKVIKEEQCADSCSNGQVIVNVSQSELRCNTTCAFYYNDKDQCVFDCPNNSYQLLDGVRKCSKCETFVLIDGAKQCQSCMLHKLDGECLTDCISADLYYDASSGLCVEQSQCKFINLTYLNGQPSEQNCVDQCKSGFSQNSICVEAYQCPFYTIDSFGAKRCGSCADNDIQLVQPEGNVRCAQNCDNPLHYYNATERICQDSCQYFIWQHAIQNSAQKLLQCSEMCGATSQTSFYYEKDGVKYCSNGCADEYKFITSDELGFKKCVAHCPEATPYYDAEQQSCVSTCAYYDGTSDFNIGETCAQECPQVYLVIDGKQTCFSSCPEDFVQTGVECFDTQLNKDNKSLIIIIVCCVIAALAIIAGVSAYYIMKRKRAGLRKGRRKDTENTDYYAKRLDQQMSKNKALQGSNNKKNVKKSAAKSQAKPVRRIVPQLPGSAAQNSAKVSDGPSPKRRGRIDE